MNDKNIIDSKLNLALFYSIPKHFFPKMNCKTKSIIFLIVSKMHLNFTIVLIVMNKMNCKPTSILFLIISKMH